MSSKTEGDQATDDATDEATTIEEQAMVRRVPCAELDATRILSAKVSDIEQLIWAHCMGGGRSAAQYIMGKRARIPPSLGS